MLFGRYQGQALGVTLHFRQRIGERVRVAADLGAAAVGLEFARARNRHLDQHRRDRRQNHHDQPDDRIGALAVAAPAEQKAELGDGGDRPGHGGGYGGNQDVAMLHMRQLVRHHAA